jgi:hypothetical protein
MCSQDRNIEKRKFTIDDLTSEERKAYDELLAQQPALILASKLNTKPCIQGVGYFVEEKGYKSSLVDSSIS